MSDARVTGWRRQLVRTSPIPISNACSAETPITPRATARIVAPAIRTKVSPCSRRQPARESFHRVDQRGAGRNRKPAMMSPMRN